MDEKTLEKTLFKLSNDSQHITAMKAHPIEDRYISLFNRITEFNAEPDKQTFDNAHSILNDPLYEDLKNTDYIKFNKEWAKFVRISASLLRQQFTAELK